MNVVGRKASDARTRLAGVMGKGNSRFVTRRLLPTVILAAAWGWSLRPVGRRIRRKVAA